MTAHTPTSSKRDTAAVIPAGCCDITPPGCDLFATTDEIGHPVVLLNNAAPPALLLGFVQGRCRELLALADLAANSNEGEAELRAVAGHLWGGLQTVIVGLGCMAEQLHNATPKKGAGSPAAAGAGRQHGTGGTP